MASCIAKNTERISASSAEMYKYISDDRLEIMPFGD